MRVFTNRKLVKNRAKSGQIANITGLVVLGAGLVISLVKPQFALYTLLLLIIGVIASQYGINTAYRYARKPRPDEELSNALKGLDDRYRQYNYLLPAYHVILTPRKLYVILTRNLAGKIICEEKKWHYERKFSFGRIFRIFSPENLGNPVREVNWDRDALKEWVRQHVDGMAVDVEPIVVFLNPQIELEVRNPEVAAVRAKSLKNHLRQTGEESGFSNETYRALAKAFDALAAPGDEASKDRESKETEKPSKATDKAKK